MPFARQSYARPLAAFVLFFMAMPFCRAQDASAPTAQQDPAGAVIHNGKETLRISVCGPDLIHIVAGPGDPKGVTPWIAAPCKADHFDFKSDAGSATVSTA